MKLPLWPRPLAWTVVIASSVMLAVGVLDLVVNTTEPWSGLTLIVLMPWPLYQGIHSIRRSGRGDRRRPGGHRR
ncbi:hypothetical protein [Curtobacterium sp. 9128]|uniref:hypothetical protein n=1 Tax=Curtobacterium sp. 9128 TaxID=1793722 RepID=UPI00119CA4F5|nr:hypothetical protein [Curtobacterium sp. 9128]